MQSRRLFLQTSAAALAAIVAGNRAFCAGVSRDQRRPITVVVCDQRIGASRDFADEAVRCGAQALHMRGDIGELWHSNLQTRVRTTPTIIAGLTREPAAYYLRSFARDIGYHQICRGDHIVKHHSVRHRVSAPTSLGSTARCLPISPKNWAASLAEVMSEIDPASSPRNRTTIGRNVHAHSDDESRLVSWVFAPINS